MKIQILFITSLLSFFSAYSQKSEYPGNNNFWAYSYMAFNSNKEKEKIADAGISGYKETITDDKRSYLWQTVKYDSMGNCIEATFTNPKGKILSQYLHTYNASGKVICSIYKKSKGEVKNKINRAYDSYGNISEEIIYHHGKEKSRILSMYDSTRLLESYFYKNGSKEFKRKWVYTYYPDKSKKSSVIYDSKGKVLYTWNYECKPEGQLAGKHKDTTAVCKNEETDKDGNKIITSRKFNEKGKPFKTVIKKNKNGQTIEYATFQGNDKPSTYYKYNDSGSFEEIIYYNLKGKEIYKTIYSYDATNNQTEDVSYKKGKQIFKSATVFNAQNFPVSIAYYNKDGGLRSTYGYSYILSN
jgi:hypothetical protein